MLKIPFKRAHVTIAAALLVFVMTANTVPVADAHEMIPNVARWEPHVRNIFGDEHVDRVMHIIWCESRGIPSVAQKGGPALGLMQFEPITWRTVWRWMTGDPNFWKNKRYDPEVDHPFVDPKWRTNAFLSLVAGKVLALEHPHGGWHHWACNPTKTHQAQPHKSG